MSQNLNELIDMLKGRRVFIQTHNFPDQDAIASAFGLQVLLEKFGIKTTICHHGNIERFNTNAMLSEFGIQVVSDEDISDMTADDYIIIVDSQKGNSNILDLDGGIIACIDHHPVFNEDDNYRYKDIRKVGSCSTIIADYYRQMKIDIPENVAAALLYGLKCDTHDFTRGVTQLDVDVYAYLFPKCDQKIISRFQTSEILFGELDAFSDSIRNVEIFNGIAFVFLDFMCADAFIAMVSDFILGVEGVNFVIVYNKRGNGFKFSVRSELDEYDAGKIINEALKGVGTGGGHASMAGGYADENKILGISIDFNKVIEDLFLEVINSIPKVSRTPLSGKTENDVEAILDEKSEVEEIKVMSNDEKIESNVDLSQIISIESIIKDITSAE